MLKEFQQRNSPAVPTRVRRRKKRNNNSPETGTSDGCQSPCHSAAGGPKEGPAPCATMKDPEVPQSAQQLQIALDSSSVTTSELNNTIDLLPSSRCGAVLEQHLQQFLQERELLKAQVAEVTESLKKAQLERDAYAQELKTERAQWQQELLKMAGEIEIFKMEKRQDAIKIEKLKGSLAHLQNHLAEPPILKHPAGHSDLEKNLKTETKYLRDELREQERLQEAKMRLREQENENRSALHLEQEGKELQEKLGEQETVPLLNAAGAGAQEEQARLCEQLQKQQMCCQHQAHPVASALREPEAAATATGTGSDRGCGETQRALQGAIDKLQNGFMAVVKENADLKERVEKLELGLIQLSGERDMIRKSIKPNDHQTAVAKTQHQKKNDVSMLSEAEEGMKVKLLELQGPVMQLMIEHEVQNPANDSTPGAPAPQELGAADKDEFYEMSPDDDSDSLEPAVGRVHHTPLHRRLLTAV
ncbi:golgin subfamily A member 2-like isoform X2 [Cebus imitator]|uniref:golgin subfamily A member 2-like isoform X2 n=1 Tax=Cebus imitator TaxID=2715852 RepID=UPI0018971DDA|nr:golgin subfamily A member 2-like isoform X2 [Cebus imitator]